jgi:hypothetical protein
MSDYSKRFVLEVEENNYSSTLYPYIYKVPQEPVFNISFLDDNVQPDIAEIPYDVHLDVQVNIREYRDFKALYLIEVILGHNTYTSASQKSLLHTSLVGKDFFKVLPNPVYDLLTSLIGRHTIKKESGFDYIGE